MASTMKAFSKDLNIDDSLSTDGVDSELSLAEDDLLDVFSGTLAFGEQHRNISLNFGRSIYIFCSNVTGYQIASLGSAIVKYKDFTVQGSLTIFSIKCNSRHLAVKVAIKYDISISVEISSNAVSTSRQWHWLVGTS